MPEVVLDNLLKVSDIRSIFCLRKVCHGLRSYIDEKPPKTNCSAMTITVLTEKIRVDLDFYDKKSIQLEYRKHLEGCSVEYEDKIKKLKNEDFTEVFSADLKEILNFQSTTLQRLSLSFKYEKDHVEESTEYISQVQNSLKKLLESRSSLLPAKHFVMSAFEQCQIMCILPYLEPESLEEITILDPTFWVKDEWELTPKELEIDEIVKLEQWKMAERISIRRSLSREVIPQFGHVKAAYITFNEINTEQMEILEQTFLQSTTLLRLRFKYGRFDGQQQFFNILGAPFERPTFLERNWYIQIPKSNDIMHILDIPHINNFAFSRIELSDVPVGAVIRG